MFIIVEGPDGSGKSSLVEELTKQVTEKYKDSRVVTFHMGKPAEESRKWCLDNWAVRIESVDWKERAEDTIIISDRWHWGEITYAPLKRPHTCKDEYGLLGLSGWRFVELALLSRGAVQFVIKQPTSVLAERVGARGDDFVQVEELARINELYDFGIKSAARVEIITPDPYSMDKLPELAEHVTKIAAERARAVGHLSMFPEYIGSSRPSVLLVGDKRNRQDVTIMPFYPINGNSGEYLMSCLPDPFWKNVGIVNGTEVCGHRLSLLWNLLGQPRIVALGRMAEKSVVKTGLPSSLVNVVPHPQYVRRFHHRDRYEYGLAIERLSRTNPSKEDPWILR